MKKYSDEEYSKKVDELHTKYDHLFEKDKEGNILRGIESPSGWLEHTEKLLESLEWYRTHNTHVPNPNYDESKPCRSETGNTPYIKGGNHNIEIFQIKEKFGRLEVYVKVPEKIKPYVYETIGMYKGLCSVTCQFCGKIEDMIPSGRNWIVNVCKQCKSNKLNT